METHNETYSCRNRKYTINIPHDLFEDLTKKAKSIDEEMPLAVYLRMLLKKDVENSDPWILERKIIAPSELPTKDAIKIKGFRFNVKKFLDKCKDAQIYLF